MGVLMADRQLGIVRREYGAADAHGDVAVVEGRGTLQGPWPGRARQESDGTWTLAVDAKAWPVAQRDLITDPYSGDEWTVTSATLLRNALDPVVDYVRITAAGRTGTDTTPPYETAGQVGA
jgi:hypothetical protein